MKTISVAPRDSVALIDAFIGPKRSVRRDNPPSVDAEARIELIRDLCSFEGRRAGTDAERRAANWLAGRLRSQLEWRAVEGLVREGPRARSCRKLFDDRPRPPVSDNSSSSR